MPATKLCPLFKAKCLKKECEWYVESYHEKEWKCAMVWIGESSAFDIEEVDLEEG